MKPTTRCPFDYLVSQYGKHHFKTFVQLLSPLLQDEDPDRYALILDIMDAVHFSAILIDDIANQSALRRNQPAAHVVFGETETATRAYLVLLRVVNRTMRENPVLAGELLNSLEEIHQGQDESLVWRRDGLETFPVADDERLAAYVRMSRLKTGSLFVLLGRLLANGGTEFDDLLVRFGLYAQLQNDCKNIYSPEYALNKGSVAEDLRNGELSYPVVVALIENKAEGIVGEALRTRSDGDTEQALRVLESPAVKDACLHALEAASVGLEDLVEAWGRREKMRSDTLDGDDLTRPSTITQHEQDDHVDRAAIDAKSDASGSSNKSLTPPETAPTTDTLSETAVGDISSVDVDYWTRRCVPIIGSLLKSCRVYSEAERETQLRFLQEHVLPNLGPRPSSPGSQIQSMATFSGFPLQPSINLSGSGQAKVRYTFEPLDSLSGTEVDPFALAPAQRVLEKLSTLLGVWPGWIDALIAAYHPTREEVEQIHPNLHEYLRGVLVRTTGRQDVQVPPMPRMWVCFVALDLEGASQALKVYFDPKIKEAVTGIPSCKYTCQILRTVDRFGNAKAVDMLEQFLAEEHSIGAVELIAIDCVPEEMQPSARIKVYVHTMSNSFQTVRKYMTMGGRCMDPATLEGLENLHDVWYSLLGESQGIVNEEYSKPLTGFSSMQHHLYFSYEMTPGNADPGVKVYIPVQSYAPDDKTIAQNYEANFRQLNWPWGEPGVYEAVIESALGPVKHSRATFLHGGSSFIFSKGRGVYQSIYLDPPLEEGGNIAVFEHHDDQDTIVDLGNM
uniref:Multifunctional aromatic prenyl transferase n=2 Tax=Epichloe festucae TaxID=35717 RepID=J7FK02_9HYPO|nr:multifunctional aromatic prenyl transferase [Epichloe festucae]